jgi:cellulose synthase/poly-beta-1,6-N-acetylglucosamine synthase-like glycosyltransferase
MSSISVIVPTLNDAQELRGLLSCLQGQEAEIVVGDGGSTDETVEVARSMGASCMVKKKGAGIECLNMAARESKGDVLLFTASDVRVERDAVSTIRRHFDDPSLVGLTGWPIIRDGPFLCRTEYWFFYMAASMLSPVRFVSSGSFMAVRRPAFERLGGFPDTYNNDGQFGAALKKLGKTKFDRSLVYYVSARRYLDVGFFAFTHQYLYTFENFIPVPKWFGGFGARLQAEHHATGRRDAG